MTWISLLALFMALVHQASPAGLSTSRVVGRIELLTGGPLPKGCSVRLGPPAAANPDRADTAKRLAELAMEATPNDQGFFEFKGVKPGIYALRAEHKEFAPAEESPVVVRAGLETVLPRPLTLRPLAVITVQIDPPLDPYDRPWRLRLARETVTGGGSHAGVADESGTWSQRGLPPGRWHLSVLGENEGIWANQTIEIDDSDSFASIEVGAVAVEGRALQGEEPFRGALWFGGARGPRRVRFDLDENGKFSGILPEEGKWEVQAESRAAGLDRLTLQPVEVRRRPGQSKARIEIEVPDTRLEGRVVDEAGKGVTANLLLIAERGGISLARTEGDGRFVLRGLPEGVVSLRAETDDLASETQRVSLEDGSSPPELTVVVRGRTRIEGVVRSAEGPLAGAEVFVWPAISQNGGGTLTRAVTNPDGSFEAVLSGTAQTVDALAYALGYGLSLSRHTIPANGSLILVLDSASGRLEVQLPPGEKEIPQDLVLFCRGAFLPAVFLLRWGTFDSEMGRLILPSAQAGEWTLCERFRPAQEPAGSGRCAQGTLFPGGNLALQSGSR